MTSPVRTLIYLGRRGDVTAWREEPDTVGARALLVPIVAIPGLLERLGTVVARPAPGLEADFQRLVRSLGNGGEAAAATSAGEKTS